MESLRCSSRPSETESSALPELLTVADVAHALGVADRYVYRLVSERRIPYLKVGHYVRFDPDEVRAWLTAAHVEPTLQHPVGHSRS